MLEIQQILADHFQRSSTKQTCFVREMLALLFYGAVVEFHRLAVETLRVAQFCLVNETLPVVLVN